MTHLDIEKYIYYFANVEYEPKNVTEKRLKRTVINHQEELNKALQQWAYFWITST